jgi:hypothetical protein
MLHQVTNYTIYYGHATSQAMSELSAKDLAIIEPAAYSAGQIGALRAAGTIVIGYLSVMEAPTWNTRRMERLRPDEFLLRNGRKVHFPEWDSYLMDLRRPSYRDLLLNEIEASIVAKGLHGIFFDTIGDIDDYVADPGLQAELREAYGTLLQDVAHAHPELVFMQNRGFDSLDKARPYLHGFVWEDWRHDWERNDWMSERVLRLFQAMSGGLRVFTVSPGSDPAHAKAAERLHFVHLNAPNGYADKVN